MFDCLLILYFGMCLDTLDTFLKHLKTVKFLTYRTCFFRLAAKNRNCTKTELLKKPDNKHKAKP